MSTLAAIESAVESLPRPQQEKLLMKLAAKLGAASPSSYDLTRDLFEKSGKLGASRLGDLSTNKAHLKGFGHSSGARRKP